MQSGPECGHSFHRVKNSIRSSSFRLCSHLMYPRITTTSDSVVSGAWVQIGDQRMLAKWKKEKKAKVDHAVASERGNFSALFLQVSLKEFLHIQSSDEKVFIETNNIPGNTELKVAVELVSVGKIDRNNDTDTLRFVFPFCEEPVVVLLLSISEISKKGACEVHELKVKKISLPNDKKYQVKCTNME